ncbi:GD12085 [Drosophila simulans]|uniref:GD12085 n=1 Tax=Drosophila simulans TaxID=7240 RepID=B4QKN3_DROSI|nr:GD12085 [Drosophila simulans]
MESHQAARKQIPAGDSPTAPRGDDVHVVVCVPALRLRVAATRRRLHLKKNRQLFGPHNKLKANSLEKTLSQAGQAPELG